MNFAGRNVVLQCPEVGHAWISKLSHVVLGKQTERSEGQNRHPKYRAIQTPSADT